MYKIDYITLQQSRDLSEADELEVTLNDGTSVIKNVFSIKSSFNPLDNEKRIFRTKEKFDAYRFHPMIMDIFCRYEWVRNS
jgi:hypothetical protein